MIKAKSYKWQKCSYIVFSIFIILLFVACDNNNSEKIQENTIKHSDKCNTETKTNRNKLIYKGNSNINSSTLMVNEETLIKKVDQFKNDIDNKEIIEGSMKSFINMYGLPINWTSSQWVIVAQWLSVINKKEYAVFTKSLSRTSSKVRALDKQGIIKYAENLLKAAKLVTDSFRANRLLLEASDIQRWYIDKDVGIQTKINILERMAKGIGHNRDLYISVSTAVADSYARDGNYKKAEDSFNEILQKLPNITSDERARILYYSALAYIPSKAPVKLRKKGFALLKQLANDNDISKEYSGMAKYTYNRISETIRQEVENAKTSD